LYLLIKQNTTGGWNVAIGAIALQKSNGTNNTAIGYSALQNSTSNNNTAVGMSALQAQGAGAYNTAVGQAALAKLAGATSNLNVAIGQNTLPYVATGSNNVGIGAGAGYYYGTGSNQLTTLNNSTLIGYSAYPLTNGDTNEIVIGYQSTGLGSNTTTIGNSSTTITFLNGTLLLGSGNSSINSSGAILQTLGGISPAINTTYDLGSLNYQWNNIYAINGTFSGSVYSNYYNVSNTIPEYRLTTLDNNYSRLQRSTASNTTYLKGMINQIGGAGSGLSFNGTTQYYSASDTGLPSGTKPIMSLSVWYYTTTGSRQTPLCYGTTVSNFIEINLYANLLNVYINNAGAGAVTTYNSVTNLPLNQWNHVVFTCDGTTNKLYFNSNLVSSGTSSFTVSTGNVLSSVSQAIYSAGTKFNGIIDQVLIYSGLCLTGNFVGSQISNLYNGGLGTYNIPTIGLIRRYDFETNGNDTNPNGTQYNLTLYSSPTYVTGITPIASGIQEGIPITYQDGQYTNEKGSLYLGDISSGTWLQGLSVKTLINNTIIPFIIGSNGYILINPTNTSQTATSSYPLTVVGGDISVNGVQIGAGNGNLNSNVAVGYQSLQLMTRSDNTAVGYQAAQNATGQYTTAIGTAAVQNATGQWNLGVGINALLKITTGGNNIGIGGFAGAYISGGTTSAQTNSGSIFIGYQAYPLANGDTNEIVIGNNAIGNGSNTTVIGNISTLSTQLFGNVIIGATSGTNLLTVIGTSSNQLKIGYDASNYMTINSTSGGIISLNATSGSPAALNLQAGSVTRLSIGASTLSGMINLPQGTSTGAISIFGITSVLTGSSGYQNNISIIPTITQTSTAGFRGIWTSPYITSTGSSTNYLLDLGTNTAAAGAGTHTSLFSVSSTGMIVSSTLGALNYANDTAAATGGVPIGGIYNTSGVLKIRLT